MTTTWHRVSNQTFTITEEILVRASLDETFASLIAQMGRQNETPDGKPLPMMIETRPGGRWYRDLGGDNGHLWGFVQSIKRPVAARDLGTAVHVDGRDLEPDVPADRSRRRHADHVHAHAGRPVPRRTPAAAWRRAGRRCTRACARPRKPTVTSKESIHGDRLMRLLAELEQEAHDHAARARARAAGAPVVAAASEVDVARPARAARRDGSRQRRRARGDGHDAGAAGSSCSRKRRRPPSSCRRSTRAWRRRGTHLGGFDDAAMNATWRLMAGGREIMAMPRAAFAPRDHAEPLVSPSRTAAGLPAAARRAGAVGVRPDGGREPVREHGCRRGSVTPCDASPVVSASAEDDAATVFLRLTTFHPSQARLKASTTRDRGLT